MNTTHRSVLVAALLSAVSCSEHDALAVGPGAAQPTQHEAPSVDRVPAPIHEAAPVLDAPDALEGPAELEAPAEAPQEPPQPLLDPQPLEELESPRTDELTPPVTDEATALELAITRCETRMQARRARVDELRSAVEKLGDGAARELLDDLAALREQLARAESKLNELRSAAETSVTQFEGELSTQLDELDLAASALAAKLP